MTDRLEASRSPNLIEVLRRAIGNAVDDMFVALPGSVLKYDPVRQVADVKPLLKKAVVHDDGTEDEDILPVLTDVPVLFPRGGGYYMSLPVAVGDNVLLVFNDRSIDNFAFSNGRIDVDPVDLRSHDISDAVAIPGFYPQTKPIKDLVSSSAVFGKELGAQVRATGSAVEITSGGLPSSVGGYVAMAQLVSTMWSLMDTVIRTAWIVAPPDGGAALKAAWIAAFPLPPTLANFASTNLKAD